MVRKMMALCLGLGILAALAIPGSASAAENDGTVYVVHGIPGVPVDVYVNGAEQLPGFQPGTVAGPLTLPAGDYSIKILAAGDPATGKPVIEKTVTLSPGADVSLVAHLDASGTPVLTAFVNDTAPAPAGEGRLVVRHTAAAPAVDVLANGSPAFTNVTNGQEGQVDIAAGTVSASVVAAGTTEPVLIGPADVPVEAGMATIVYAIGAPASGSNPSTLGVVTQQIPLTASAMTVNTGTSGLLDRERGVPTLVVVGLGLAVAAFVVSVGRLRGARARA